MSTILLIGVILVLLLAILLFFFFFLSRTKEKTSVLTDSSHQTYNELLDIIKNKNTSKEKLNEAIFSIIDEYGTISDLKKYQNLIYRLVSHPHVNKAIIIDFESALIRKNPHFEKEISKAIIDGLNYR